MKVLHLAAANRWTGAAAPAFAEVAALREAGVDAHYAYVGGYKLQAKLAHEDFAHPLIDKAQNPLSFARTVDKLDAMVERHGFDIVHAHLTYDHWLARMVARGRVITLARTFHARRVLRTDPFTRALMSRTPLAFTINEAFRTAPLLKERNAIFTPPPVDHRQFTPLGANARELHGIPNDAIVLTSIGKLSKGRGFEDALRTFAIVRSSLANARMMIIGHGEHRSNLEQLAHSLGIADHVRWAGYHEDDLAEHYRASDALLFTARGSDEGHRAILEAMACGVPPAGYPLEGVTALVDRTHVAAASTPEALATTVLSLLSSKPDRGLIVERSLEFSYRRAARRLIDAYASVIR